VTSEDGVTAEWLKAGDFRVRTPETRWSARLQIAPFYDPKHLRILDEDGRGPHRGRAGSDLPGRSDGDG